MLKLLTSSLVAIVAVAAVTVGTMAAFTNSDFDDGTVNAGTVIIDVVGSEPNTLDFATSCPTPLAPGDSCTDIVTVTNNGSLAVTLSEPAHDITDVSGGVGDPENCSSYSTSVNANYTADSEQIAPGDSATFDVTVTLIDEPDQNDCQGTTATVQVSVTATGVSSN
jgi:predicted ribosomally synthesized peptide with SipW-like signal peptide